MPSIINLKTKFFIFNLIFLVFLNTGLEAKEWKRKILGIYDSSVAEEAFIYNKIQVHAHAIFNYYGYYIKLLDLRKEKLPTQEEMKNYAGVISWLESNTIKNPNQYLLWLEKNKKAGRKFIFLGYSGMDKNEESQDSLPAEMKRRFYRLLDLDYRENYEDATTKVKVSYKDPGMIGFERKLDFIPGKYEKITPLNKNIKSWLKLTYNSKPDSESSIVTTSPSGGFIMDGYAIWEEIFSPWRKRWIINPFKFFKEVFNSSNIPIPDPTTILGRRIFYSHIDGDAFLNQSQIPPSDKMSGEMIKEVIQTNPEIKVGASFIVAEVSPEYKGSQKLVEIAREILKLDNVETASHTFTHPYKWRGSNRTSAYSKKPFNLEQELTGSIEYINNVLAPKNKKLKTLYWSGDTSPPVKAFTILEKAGVQNINGGDSIFDNYYNSYSGVSPFVRSMGKYWQIHSSNSNENLYTNLWTEDFNGFYNLTQTFERTDKPIRMSAANAYYHFYTGDKIASINALKKIYQYAKDKNYYMIFPSQYIEIVKGFLSTKVIETAPGIFKIKDRGELNTLRLDQGKVDLKSSKGILQINKINQSLYISLDPKVKEPVIRVIK